MNTNLKVGKEALGCLCWFWLDNENDRLLGVLADVVEGARFPYRYKGGFMGFKNCRPITLDEIKIFSPSESIGTKMESLAEELGYDTSENLQKIANAKAKFFGYGDWRRCPCDGNNPDRYCGSELCKADIARDGICHCRCYLKREECKDGKASNSN